MPPASWSRLGAQATVQRAREPLQRSITCAEPRSSQPSGGTLRSCGFESWFTRDAFSGTTSRNRGVAFSTVRTEPQAATVMARPSSGAALHRDFRPLVASVESQADLLTNGFLLGAQADRRDLVAGRLSKACRFSKEFVVSRTKRSKKRMCRRPDHYSDKGYGLGGGAA